MKKIYLSATIAALVGLGSCNTDSNTEFKISFDSPTINLVTDNSTGETVAVNGVYHVNLDYGPMLGDITSDDLELNDSKYYFDIPETKILTNGFVGHAIFNQSPGTVSGNSTYPLSDDVVITTPTYYTSSIGADKYTYKPSLLTDPNKNEFLRPIVVANYGVGTQYRVRTFQNDTFYSGETKTTYQDGAQTYTTKTIGYRLHIDKNLDTAVFIIYNAKFSSSEKEPVKQAIIAEGLKVTYAKDKIIAEGEDIIPLWVEGDTTTPLPPFIFNSIKFETTDTSMTECQISYQVGGQYFGTFKGSYVF